MLYISGVNYEVFSLPGEIITLGTFTSKAEAINFAVELNNSESLVSCKKFFCKKKYWTLQTTKLFTFII